MNRKGNEIELTINIYKGMEPPPNSPTTSDVDSGSESNEDTPEELKLWEQKNPHFKGVFVQAEFFKMNGKKRITTLGKRPGPEIKKLYKWFDCECDIVPAKRKRVECDHEKQTFYTIEEIEEKFCKL